MGHVWADWDRVYGRAVSYYRRHRKRTGEQLVRSINSGGVYHWALRAMIKDVVLSLDENASGGATRRNKNMALRRTSVE